MKKKISTQYYENHMDIVEELQKSRDLKWLTANDFKDRTKNPIERKGIFEYWGTESALEGFSVVTKGRLADIIIIVLDKLHLISITPANKKLLFTEKKIRHALDCALLHAIAIVRNDACDAKWGYESRYSKMRKIKKEKN